MNTSHDHKCLLLLVVFSFSSEENFTHIIFFKAQMKNYKLRGEINMILQQSAYCSCPLAVPTRHWVKLKTRSCLVKNIT